MNHRKDRYGLAYGELLTIQKEHLVRWKDLLTPEVYASTVKVVNAKNCPTQDQVHGLHCVPRGAELANLILDYPKHAQFLSEAYQSALD